MKLFGSAGGPEIAEESNLVPATVKNTLGRSLELGIVEARGTGRSRRFHLTARFYDMAQDREAYVRLKGVDPLQQERMIFDYVRPTVRSHVVKWHSCVRSLQSRRALLKRLVEENRLRLVGEHRGARSTLPDTP